MSRSRSEAARMLGVTRDRLARWEREGLARVERDERGQPRYPDTEIDRLAAALRDGPLAQGSLPPLVRERQLAAAPALSADTLRELLALLPEPPGDGGDLEVHRLVTAAARSRAEVARLEAEVEEIRARAKYEEVTRAHQAHRRNRRVELFAAHAAAGVPDQDRALAEQLVRQRLAAVVDLDAWLEVAVAVRDGVEAARAQRSDDQRVAEARAEAAARAAAMRKAAQEAARAAAAHAAELAEAQRESAARTQAAARAQQLRAQAVAQAVAAEVASYGAPNWVVEAAGQAAFGASSAAPVQDDLSALNAGRSAGWSAVEGLGRLVSPGWRHR